MCHHRHAFPYVTIVLDGSYVEVRDAAPHLCRSGALVVHVQGEEHADRFASDTRCLNVEVPPEPNASDFSGGVALERGALRDAVTSVVLSFYFRPRRLTAAVSALHAALAQWRCADRGDAPAWLASVIDGFAWTEPVALADAAAFAGLHETHFSRAFRRYAGVTPTEYRARTRLRLASKLLLTTPASVASVALQCGFSDQSHLTRAFSQRLGLTPARYRRAFAR
jgi:AraC family transcriptional regulator